MKAEICREYCISNLIGFKHRAQCVLHLMALARDTSTLYTTAGSPQIGGKGKSVGLSICTNGSTLESWPSSVWDLTGWRCSAADVRGLGCAEAAAAATCVTPLRMSCICSSALHIWRHALHWVQSYHMHCRITPSRLCSTGLLVGIGPNLLLSLCGVGNSRLMLLMRTWADSAPRLPPVLVVLVVGMARCGGQCSLWG